MCPHCFQGDSQMPIMVCRCCLGVHEQPSPFEISQSLAFHALYNCGLIRAKSNMSIVSQGEEEASMTQLINRKYFFPPTYGKDNKLSPITWEGSTCPMWLCTCARGFDTQGGGFQLFGGKKKGKC